MLGGGSVRASSSTINRLNNVAARLEAVSGRMPGGPQDLVSRLEKVADYLEAAYPVQRPPNAFDRLERVVQRLERAAANHVLSRGGASRGFGGGGFGGGRRSIAPPGGRSFRGRGAGGEPLNVRPPGGA
mmetsp:Transcript_6732/g.14875  ORF Transcript_6732/g.14875 Transcript_6732/m.14875 type:complete len:129 (-) Transcript_6732:63-449(-)